MIDTSIVRVHQHGACITRNQRQSMGRSRGGLTSKIHAVVDSNGLPVRLALSPGEAHDVRLAGKLLSRLKSGSMLLADRGYDADWIRKLAMKKGAWANIPPKSNRSDPICFSPYLYRARNQVERFFNRIKHCRRVATRYDKLAANYLAFVQLASIRLWLAARYESTSLVLKELNHEESRSSSSLEIDGPDEPRVRLRWQELPPRGRPLRRTRPPRPSAASGRDGRPRRRQRPRGMRLKRVASF
jgi:transposase